MQRRAQRVGREVLLPQSRGQQMDLGGRVAVDALQHIDEVVVGVDPVRSAGDQQTLEDADILGAHLRPTEHPVVAVMVSSP